jgi:cardiolipin synthase A/B
MIDGNTITLLQNGEQFFPALISEIRGAVSNVHIETYIYVEDHIGLEVSAALKAAAARGVKVRLLIDGIGSRGFAVGGAEALRQAGIDVRVYKKDNNWFSLARARLRRLHRKVTVIDGRVAFVGGINIVSDFAPPNTDTPQFDYCARIEGPLVKEIHINAAQVWLSTFPRYLRRTFPTIENDDKAVPEGKASAAFIYRDNFRNRRTIEKQLRLAIDGAKSEVLLANAYFLPGLRFRHSLRAAAKRGVTVKLLLQGHTDHVFLRAATRYLYAHLISSGVYIAEYERAMLHAKVCVVDSEWACVGSSNLDPFSLMLSREANVVVRETDFAIALRTSLLSAIETEGASIAPALWQRRPLQEKTKSALAYGCARIGLAAVGLSGRLDT